MSDSPTDDAGADERIWQGVRQHLAEVEPLVPTEPTWTTPIQFAVQRAGGGRRLAGVGLGAAAAFAAAVIVVATLTLGPLGSPRGTASPVAPGTAWTRLRLQSVPTGNLFRADDQVATAIAWRGGFIVGGAAFPPGSEAGLFVRSAAIWWSSEGRTWHRATVDQGDGAERDGAEIRSIINVGDHLLAVGGPLFLPSCPVRCWTSPPAWFWESSDGRTWTRLATDDTFLNPVESFDRPVITDLAWSGNGFVAVGGTGIDSPAMWTSPDGRTWREVDLGTVMPHGELGAVAWADHDFVAVGSVLDQPLEHPLDVSGPRHSVVLTSKDGRRWQITTIQPSPARPLDRAFAGASGAVVGATGCAACATSAPFYESSSDGSWTSMEPSGPTDADLVASSGQRILSIRPKAGSTPQAWQTQGSGGWQAIPVDGTFGPQDSSKLTLEAMAVGPDGVAVAGQVLVGDAWQPRMWLATPAGAPNGPPATKSPGPTPSATTSAVTTPSPPSGWASLAWQSVSLPDSAGGATVTSIAAWRGGFVAGGWTSAAGGINAVLWASEDGVAWQRVGEGLAGTDGARIVEIVSTPTGLLGLGEIPGLVPTCPAPDKGAPTIPTSAMPCRRRSCGGLPTA